MTLSFMTLWLVLGVMTVAAIVAVSWPLWRARRTGPGGSDLIVYKDQLKEIDTDRATGLIGEAEAEAARLEVSRRLLAAADAQPSDAPAAAGQAAALAVTWRRRAAALAVFVVLLLGPPGLYLALGSPNVPGQPTFTRAKTPHGHESIADLVGQVEAHLEHAPNDGRGWELIGPVYMRLGRFDDAVEARRKSLVLNGENATREADLGEALAAAADGVVTVEAKQAFERAIADDAHEAKARYFLGLAAEQDGKAEAAATIWRSLLADAPSGAPWIGLVRGALARATGAPAAPPGPSAGEIASASAMSGEQRLAMVRGMVARLAGRLHDDGADVEGWLRLVRAYVVLGDRDKAKDAAAEAKRVLANRPDEIKRIDDLVKGLGLEG